MYQEHRIFYSETEMFLPMETLIHLFPDKKFGGDETGKYFEASFYPIY